MKRKKTINQKKLDKNSKDYKKFLNNFGVDEKKQLTIFCQLGVGETCPVIRVIRSIIDQHTEENIK